MFSAAVAIIGLALLVILLARAIEGGFVSRLPFFYFYIAYILAGTILTLGCRHFLPQHYPSVFWFYFLVSQVTEFAVLIEVSDHIFEPYPTIRSLGRFLCGSVSSVFLVVYIFPSFLQHGQSSNIVLGLVKRTSLTKALIILVLLAAVRSYKLVLGRSISGVLLGFSIYLGVNIANFEMAEIYGAALYAPTFRIVGPLSWTIGSLVWVIALWRYEPGVQASRRPLAPEQGITVPLHTQLDRFNDTLFRLLQK